MSKVEDESVNLIVTSPPYPMISMWDEIFSSFSPDTKDALVNLNGNSAFDHMHGFLDAVWSECYRLLKPGGFACINIGDATRKIGDDFRLYPNHSRITETMLKLGFDVLPMIHWFKPTNAPNKFMGSGMLPSGAYVTLEHEYILIFRKGGKRSFTVDEKQLRRRSAYFWEERNSWFSDVWNFKGTTQRMKTDAESRKRSGAFPFELPYRLINMYSMQGDTVLDPFLGTATTMAAAVVCGRRSIGWEIDKGLSGVISQTLSSAVALAENLNTERLARHCDFIVSFTERKGQPKHMNRHYGFPVVTAQESDIILPHLRSFHEGSSDSEMTEFESDYS